jgi:hypothetical protein
VGKMSDRLIGRGRVGKCRIYIGEELGANPVKRKVWLDFTLTFVLLLVGRRRIGKSYTERKCAENLAEPLADECRGILPRFILLDPLGNLIINLNSIKNITLPHDLQISFSTLTVEQLFEYLTVGAPARVIKRILRKAFELNRERTKEGFCEIVRDLVMRLRLHQSTEDGLLERIAYLEEDQMIVDDAKHLFEESKNYRGIRVDLSQIHGDSFRLRFFCNWLCRELLERGRKITMQIATCQDEETLNMLRGELICLMVDEFGLVNFDCFTELVRQSGNSGISVILASQKWKDFKEITDLADVIFGFQMEDPKEFYKKFFNTSLALDAFKPKLDVGETLVWQNDGPRGFKIKIGKCRTTHLGGD